jgi:NCS2 family nucleobase:cation symporter-2
MFGMTAIAGIQELARVNYKGTNNALVAAVSIAAGMLPIATPQLFARAPEQARLFLNSGIFLATVTAVILNLILARPDVSKQTGRNDGTE